MKTDFANTFEKSSIDLVGGSMTKAAAKEAYR